MEFPIVFTKCPICKSTQTVSQNACKDEPSIPKGTFTSLEKMATPIQDIRLISLPVVKGILCHYDVCAGCGIKRCTKVELVSIPAAAFKQFGQAIAETPPKR